MAYFLAVLKVLGLIAVYFIALVLLLAALVLWVPVRYRATVQNQFSFLYSFRISWLGGFVTVKKDKFSSEIWLQVLGIRLRRLNGEEEEQDEREELQRKSREKGTSPRQNTADRENIAESEEIREKKTEKRELSGGTDQKSQRERTRQKNKKVFSFDRLSTIIDFIRDTDNKTGFRIAFSELRALLCYLAPRHLKGRAVIGVGNPAATGILFGFISLFPLVYQEGVTICPDFETEEMVFQVNGEMDGRMTVWHFICLAVRIYRDTKLKKLWSNFNRMRDALSTD